MARKKKLQPVTYFSTICGRFDPVSGIVSGVSVLTSGMAKGHDLRVDDQTLLEVKHAAESFPDGRLKCKLNHRSGVDDVFGYLSDFRVDGPKLLADLHMFKSHDKYEQTFEQLRELPNALGLSVAFVGKEARDRDGMKLARCQEILSADLVPEPAANPTGLFEAKLNPTQLQSQLQVDNQNNFNMDTDSNTVTQDNASQGQGGGVTNEQILEVLQALHGRMESVEAFQQAIQAELEASNEIQTDENGNLIDAEGNIIPVDAEGNPIAQGDDGNQGQWQGHGAQGDNAQGGTQQNGGQHHGANMGMAPAMAAEFSEIKRAITMLERRAVAQEEEAERAEFDGAINILQTKMEAVTEFAAQMQLENDTLRHTLETGVKPVRAGLYELDRPDLGTFEQLIKKYEQAGKKKGEAIMLAAKESPKAHREYLERSGVQLATL